MLSKENHTTALFSESIRDMVLDTSKGFNPLSSNFILDVDVTAKEKGLVNLNVTMPQEMTTAFVQLLESMQGLFFFIEKRSRTAVSQVKVIDPAAETARAEVQQQFRDLVVGLFDELAGQGVEPKEAVKQVNHSLKAQGHPWATHDQVTAVLRAEGRFRKNPRGSERSE